MTMVISIERHRKTTKPATIFGVLVFVLILVMFGTSRGLRRCITLLSHQEHQVFSFFFFFNNAKKEIHLAVPV
jgi:hypothetical protein